MINTIFLHTFMLTLLTVCSYHDIKKCTVPQYLTFLAILTGISSAILTENVRLFLIVGFITIVIGYFLAEFDIWGGADSQLLIAMGFLLGFSNFFIEFFYVSIVYGVIFLGYQNNYNKNFKIPFVPTFLITYIIWLML